MADRTTIMKRAAQFGIGEVTVIGRHLVGVSRAGHLYVRDHTRWMRLERFTTTAKRARRAARSGGTINPRANSEE